LAALTVILIPAGNRIQAIQLVVSNFTYWNISTRIRQQNNLSLLIKHKKVFHKQAKYKRNLKERDHLENLGIDKDNIKIHVTEEKLEGV